MMKIIRDIYNNFKVMAENGKERLTAAIDDDIVVFIIGMRVNAYWKVYQQV